METWQTLVNGDIKSWLLDPIDPAVRHLALQWLRDSAHDDADVVEAQVMAMQSPPIADILDLQRPDGSWQEREQTFSPMYRSSAWQVIFLGELGADGGDSRVRKGVEDVLDTAQDPDGTFPARGRADGGRLLCFTALAVRALLQLGYSDDARTQRGLDALCALVREQKSACRHNAELPCAWAAVKVLRALALVPEEKVGVAVQQAIDVCAELVLSRDPSVGDYPTKSRPSGHWRRLSVPRGFQSDTLEAVEALALVGRGQDPSLVPSIQFILEHQGPRGRWKSTYYLNGKMLVDWEERGPESKWVSLHVARTLRLIVG